VDLASLLLSLSLLPLTLGICIDAYLLVWMVVGSDVPSLCAAARLLMVLAGLWLVAPQFARQARQRAQGSPERP
jgi:hypothetical protein